MVAAGAMAAAWLACAPAAVEAATLDRVRDTATFRIGYRADAKPYSFRNENGQAAGYIVDLCLEVAAALRAELNTNIKVEFVLVPADLRFESVRDGKIDILCDPSSATIPRREMVDFSLPTFLDGAGVMYRTAKPVNRFEDIANRRVGVLSGTTTEQMLRETLGSLSLKAEIVSVRDHNAGIDLLSSDKIDAYFADRAIITAMLYAGDRPGFQVGKQYYSMETYALALPRDDGAFRLLVDRTLARLYRGGRINIMIDKTFGPGLMDGMLSTMILINSLPDK